MRKPLQHCPGKAPLTCFGVQRPKANHQKQDHNMASLRNNTMKIQLSKPEHINGWMALVEQVRDAFPGLETAEAMAEHRATVLQFI